jgi:hypothetical protein
MTPTNHPAPESEREAIARIIHPEAFDGTLSGHPDNWEDKMAALENQAEAQLVALAKADAILSRMGWEPVAVAKLADELDCLELQFTSVANSYKGYLPYSDEGEGTPDSRTRNMLIKDCTKAFDDAFERVMSSPPVQIEGSSDGRKNR